MIEILVYAFGVMYTPGPANLLSLNAGLSGHVYSTLRFSLGVGAAMLILFILFGYTGAWLVSPRYQLFISCAGSLYILYLAFKIANAKVQPDSVKTTDNIGFKTGLFLQLLNPKAFIAILPIVTVQFPSEHITGISILLWSFLLSALAFGAPASYLFMGNRLGKLIDNPRYFQFLNIAMAILLLYVAIDIIYHHVYLKLV